MFKNKFGDLLNKRIQVRGRRKTIPFKSDAKITDKESDKSPVTLFFNYFSFAS